MKKIVIVAALLAALLLVAHFVATGNVAAAPEAAEDGEEFVPSRTIPAGSSVSFPVDI
jgi:hypothetical protein